MSLSKQKFLSLCKVREDLKDSSLMALPEIVQLFARIMADDPPLIWLKGQCCSGCSESLISTAHHRLKEYLHSIINRLESHPNRVSGQGGQVWSLLQRIIATKEREFILVIEGAVPTREEGRESQELRKLVTTLGGLARITVAVGSCASQGGPPVLEPDPLCSVKKVAAIVNRGLINIPGCPPHPNWIICTLIHVLMFGMPELDEQSRPLLFYGNW